MQQITPAEILRIAENIVFRSSGQHLTDLQRLILSKSLEGKKYSEIEDYTLQHVKNEGAKLWQLLSTFLGESVSKSNFRAALERYGQTVHSPTYDWGEAPDVPFFFGRTKDLTKLRQWILDEGCKLVVVAGMAGMGKTGLSVKLGKGGIGKTDLTLTLAQGIQSEFEYVIWRRLLNAPTISEILEDCLSLFSRQQNARIPETTEEQISALLHYLQQHRSLLVLDNIESILESGSRQGYLPGYEEYGRLFQKIASLPHQSCLLLTTREIPAGLERWEGSSKPVRFYFLSGLCLVEGQKLVSTVDSFSGSDQDWANLVALYNGNPLALELTAHYIKTVFGGSITRFLNTGNPIFRDLRDILDWHFERLSEPEKDLVYWLAINREPISIDDLRQDLVATWQFQLPDVFQSLRKKLPLEETDAKSSFMLQPVLVEYVTQRLIEEICQELKIREAKLFNSHALLKAQSKDYVRESQKRVILTPILERLLIEFSGRLRVQARLNQLLTETQSKTPLRPGYLAGNILNLLCQLSISLQDYDLSRLAIWQAYLQDKTLRGVDFSHSDLRQSVFMKAFGGIHAVTFSPDAQCLAVGDSYGKIRLIRIEDDQQIAVSQAAHKWLAVTLSFSPDGQRLVSGASDNTPRLWRLPDLQCLQVLEGHTDWVWGMAFSSDGQLIASASDDMTVRLWDGHTGAPIQVLHGHEGWVVTVALSGAENSWQSQHENVTTLANSIRQSKASRLA